MPVNSKCIEGDLLKVIIDEIKHSIAKKTCPIHNEKARLVITGDTLDDLKISAEGCCEKFVKEVSKEIKIEVR